MSGQTVSSTARLSRWASLAITAAVAAAAGCGSLPRNPVPVYAVDLAIIPGMPGVRTWGGEHDEEFHQDLIRSVHDERASDYCTADGTCDHAAIALSGGGAHGAFGAGFLKGWEDAEGRPIFKLVTGISTGALMAPAVFLGADYDKDLEALFTSAKNKDIYKRRSPFKLVRTESLATMTPLAAQIEETVDGEMIRRIAEGHSQGRRLLIGTTNLDAGRLVVWNMGAIASSGHPDAAALFRKVLLASASIPVVFPPVYFEVVAKGLRYDEMHVDGGVMAELFVYEDMLDLDTARRELRSLGHPFQRGSIYVIRNGQAGPDHKQVRRKITTIARRSLLALLETVGRGDLFRVWTLAQDAGFSFKFVGIPVDYELDLSADFDPEKMRELFDLGYRMALEDDRWQTTPPWIEE